MTRDELQVLVDQHGSFAAAARAVGVSGTTFKVRCKAHGVQSRHPRATQKNPLRIADSFDAVADTDSVKSFIVDGPFQPEQLLRDQGLDPAEWNVTNARPNSWQALAPEGEVVTLHQLKVEARRRLPRHMLVPARSDTPYRTLPLGELDTGIPQTIALVSDQHCPHQDVGLESCWHQWLIVNQPQRIIGLGDIVNLAKPSRHRPNLHAKHNDTPTECFQGAHDWWRRTLDHAPDGCEADQLPGNHDLRAQIACMEALPDLYDVTRPGERHPWWDLEYLMGLDQLGVRYHRPDGEYHAAELHLAKGLTLAHGAKAGPYGGAARDMPRHEGSRVTGHDHKSALTHVVRYRDGEPRVHLAASIGTMSRRDLGYTPDPDTQQGFGVVTLHPSGLWNLELARYDARRRVLYYRDQLYHAAS